MLTPARNPFVLFFDPNRYTRLPSGHYRSPGGRVMTQQQFQAAVQRMQQAKAAPAAAANTPTAGDATPKRRPPSDPIHPDRIRQAVGDEVFGRYERGEMTRKAVLAKARKSPGWAAAVVQAAKAPPAAKAGAAQAAPDLAAAHMADAPPEAKAVVADGLADAAKQGTSGGLLAAAGRLIANIVKLPFRAARAAVLGVLRVARFASDRLGLLGRTAAGAGGMWAGGWLGAQVGSLLGPLGTALGTGIGAGIGALVGRGDTESLGRLFTLRGSVGATAKAVAGHLLNVALIPAAGMLPLLVPAAMSALPGVKGMVGEGAMNLFASIGRSLFGADADGEVAGWLVGGATSLGAMALATLRMKRKVDAGLTDVSDIRVTYTNDPNIIALPEEFVPGQTPLFIRRHADGGPFDAFAFDPANYERTTTGSYKHKTARRYLSAAQFQAAVARHRAAAKKKPAAKPPAKKAAPKRKPAAPAQPATAPAPARPAPAPAAPVRQPDPPRRSGMAYASAPLRPWEVKEVRKEPRAKVWGDLQAARGELQDLARRLRQQVRDPGRPGIRVDVGTVRAKAQQVRRLQREFAVTVADEPTPPAVERAAAGARSPLVRAAGWVAHKLGRLTAWLGGTVLPGVAATGTAFGVAGLGATTGAKLGLLFGGPLGMAVGTAVGGGLGLLAARAVAVPAFRVASAAMGATARDPLRRLAVSGNKLASAVLPRAAGLATAAPVGAVTVPLGMAATGAMTPVLGPALGLAATGALGRGAEDLANAVLTPGMAGIFAPGRVYGGVAGAVRSGLESDPRRRKREGTTLKLGRSGRQSAGSYESRFSEQPDDLAELKALLPQVAPGLALTDADLRLILAAVTRAAGGAAPAAFREQPFESFYWQMTKTRTRKPKAVWTGAAPRRPLYGEDAERAVKAQGGSAKPPRPEQTSVVPADPTREPLVGPRTRQAAAQVGGLAGGAAAGAKVGAVLGGPLGAAVGTAVGGGLGGAVGPWAAEKLTRLDGVLGRGVAAVLTGLVRLPAESAVGRWVGDKWSALMDRLFGARRKRDGVREGKTWLQNLGTKYVARTVGAAAARFGRIAVGVRDQFRRGLLAGVVGVPKTVVQKIFGLFDAKYRANVRKLGGGPLAVLGAAAIELTAGVYDWTARVALNRLPFGIGRALNYGIDQATKAIGRGAGGGMRGLMMAVPQGRLLRGRPTSAVRARRAAGERLMFGPQGGRALISARSAKQALAAVTPAVRWVAGDRLRFDPTKTVRSRANRPFVTAVGKLGLDPKKAAEVRTAMAVLANYHGFRRNRDRTQNDLVAALRAQKGGRFAERFAEPTVGLPQLLAGAKELLADLGHTAVPDRQVLAALGAALHALTGGGPVDSFAWKEGPRGGDYWLPPGRPDTPDNRLYGEAARAAAEAARAAFGKGPNEYGDVHLDDGHTVSLKPDAGGAVRIDFAKHGNAMKAAPALQAGSLDFLRRLRGLMGHLAARRTPVAFGGADARRERLYAGELRAAGYAPVGLRADMTVEWRHGQNLGGKRPLTDAEYEALVRRLPARMAEYEAFFDPSKYTRLQDGRARSPGGRVLSKAQFDAAVARHGAKKKAPTKAQAVPAKAQAVQVQVIESPGVRARQQGQASPALSPRVVAAESKMSRAQKAKVNALFDKIRGIDYALSDGIPDHLTDARRKLRAERAELVKQIEAILPPQPKPAATTPAVPATNPVVAKPPTVAEATFARAQAEYPRLRDEYLGLHGTFKQTPYGVTLTGVTLNTDEWRGQFPEYTGTNAADTHEAASYLNDRLFQEALTKLKGKGNGRMIVLAGGGGSGKGTATKGMGLDEYPIRLDQVSGDFDKLMKKFALGQQNGFAPEYTFIDRAPKLAWDGVVSRAVNGRKKGGVARTVPLEIALRANLDARAVALRVLKERPDIPATVIDNNGEPGTARMLVGADAVRHLERQQHDYQTLLEELRRDTLNRPGLDDDIRTGLVGPAAADDRRVQPAGPPGRAGAGAAVAGAGRPAGGAGGEVRQARAGHDRRLTARDVQMGRRIRAAVEASKDGKTMAELRKLTGLPAAEFDRLAWKLHTAGVVRLLDDGSRPADAVRSPGNRLFARITPGDPKTAVSMRSVVGRQRTEGHFAERLLKPFRV